jgi:hypothetical protein
MVFLLSLIRVSRAESLETLPFHFGYTVPEAGQFSLSGEPHEKWTALYSLSDKCRIAGGQNSSKKRTEILL